MMNIWKVYGFIPPGILITLQKINVLIPLSQYDKDSFLLSCRLPKFSSNYMSLSTETYRLIQRWKMRKNSLSSDNYLCQPISFVISFPYSPAFAMPLAINEKVVALVTNWCASADMKAHSFEDVVFASSGTISLGPLRLLILEIVHKASRNQVAITITFAQRGEWNDDTWKQQQRSPRVLIGKIARLLQQSYKGFPITIQPLCSRCQNKFRNSNTTEDVAWKGQLECRYCEEWYDPPDFSQWPRCVDCDFLFFFFDPPDSLLI